MIKVPSEELHLNVNWISPVSEGWVLAGEIRGRALEGGLVGEKLGGGFGENCGV